MKHRQTADCSMLEPRSPPHQVRQQKITKTFSNLLVIPFSEQCAQIKHLYLSHNVITDLHNIESYVSLESLNVSYNQLSDITELNRIFNKHLIKRLGLRMNHFQYGYQDYAVALFSNLKRIDDVVLPETQQKRKNYQIAMFIGNNILMCKQRLNQLKENLIKCQSFNSLPKQIIQDLSVKYLLSEYIAKKSISQLLYVLFDIVKLVNEDCFIIFRDDYIRTIKKQFSQFLQLILLNFSNRNEMGFLKSIQKYDNIKKGFASIGVYKQIQKMSTQGGKKYNLNVNSGKYVSNQQNKQDYHKMNKRFPLNNIQNDPLSANVNELIKLDKQIEEFYERIPIFVYEKNYLQVITEIIMNQIGVVLEMYKKMSQYLMIKKQQQKIRQQQSKQKNNNLNQITKKQLLNEVHSLSLSNSLPSFGIQQNQFQFKEQIKNQPKINKNLQQNSFEDRKTILKTKDNCQFSVEKYQLREINLIFKVFRGLKLFVKRKILH